MNRLSAICVEKHYLVSLYGTYNDIVKAMYILKNEREHVGTLGRVPQICTTMHLLYNGLYGAHRGGALSQGYSHFPFERNVTVAEIFGVSECRDILQIQRSTKTNIYP